MSLFAGDAADAIVLAEDEARMLGRSRVEPEHLLLAIFRRGRVTDLFNGRLTARELYAAIVADGGIGDELRLGRLPRSRATDEALARAIAVAGERGARHPDSVHLLLSLADDDRAGALLVSLGLSDLERLVDDRFPPRGTPLSAQQARVELVEAAMGEGTPDATPAVPAFERFTYDARRAIRAAAESAASLEHREVDPFHLLIGCLQVPESLAARVLTPIWEPGELGPIGEVMDLACRYGPAPSHQATGIFSPRARRVVAEDAVRVAYRAGQTQITTGHLLIATLDSSDRTTEAMTRPHTQRLARTLTRGLPGSEHGPDEGEIAWIRFDDLIRTLILGFRRILPPGWTIYGSARSDLHLRVPHSGSESDFQIRPGWVTAEPGPARERLQRVTRWMLERLQADITEASGRAWPETPDHQAAPVHAQLIEDPNNPRLRLGYGDPRSPVIAATEHDILLNMVIGTS